MNRWDTSRIEAFSDGVFAIAITLLVLDIDVPPSAYEHLFRGFADQWPAYLAFATSFMTIGGIWMLHHAVFRRLRYANTAVMRINLVLLMTVSFLPFPTRIVAEAIESASAERAAVVIYGTSVLTISIVFAVLSYAIARDPELLQPGVSAREVRALVRAVQPNAGFYVAFTFLAGVAPRIAAFGFLASSIAAILRTRGDSGAPGVEVSPG
ncbi:MAG TPA: TMEM175 family protein [Gaiellales bacterium]|nr:TMEM175 family protein [Gaiellales bacterium]